MQPLSDTILAIVSRRPEISDVELAFAIYGRPVQQLVNGECRHLAGQGLLLRASRADALIGNTAVSGYGLLAKRGPQSY